MKYNQPYGNGDTNAPYINGNPAAGIQGSIVPAEAIEFDQREIVNSINFAGLTPSNGNLQQLWQSIQRNPWLTHAAVDGGTPSALAATLNPSPVNLFFGMIVRIKVAHDCVGPSTLNLNALGAYPVTRANGAACAAGDFLAGEVLNLDFDGANWQIENWTGPPGATSTVNNYKLSIPYTVAGGTPNALTGAFTPPITSLAAGDPFLVKAIAVNTDVMTLAADALAAKPIIWPDGSTMRYGDVRPGAILWLIYDGTSYQLLSVTYPRTAVGFGSQSGPIAIPSDTFVRVSPTGPGVKNSLVTSTFSNGVFTCGAGETGWWAFAMDAQYIPGGAGVVDGSAWVARITGPNGYYTQHNAQFAGNQGNGAAVAAVMFCNQGNQVIFDLYHMLGAGATTGVNINGVRIGR